MSFETSALILTWVAILLLALVVSGLIRQVHVLTTGRIHLRPGDIGLAPGARAPKFREFATEPPSTTLLLFLSEGCSVCEEVLDEAVALTERNGSSGFTAHALFPGAAPGRAELIAKPARIRLLAGQAELYDSYKIAATPFAVVVDELGTITTSEPVGSRDMVRHLFDQTETDKGQRTLPLRGVE